MSSKIEKTKENKEKKVHSPLRNHSNSKDSQRRGKSSKSKDSHDNKSSRYDQKKDSYRREKYKSKYQTRKSKERKEKKRNEKDRSSFQNQLNEDQKKCKQPVKKQVKFEDDKKLITSKFFSIVDEPIAQALTEEKVEQIRKRLAEQLSSSLPQLCSSEELKHKESLMEGLRRRQNEKEVINKLVEMKPMIAWYQPLEFLMEQKYAWGEESTEIEAHDKRMSTKLRCFYPTADHIPPEPNFAIINNKYSVKQVQQIQLYTDVIQDFETQAITKQQLLEAPIKHAVNLKQPKKSILKKSREQLQKEKDEEQKRQQQLKEQQKKEKEQLKEKKKKEKLAKENAKKLTPETLKKLIGVLQSCGTPTPELAEELKSIMKSMHDQGIDTQSILQHIKLLKETVLKSTKKIRKDNVKIPFQSQQNLQSKFLQINSNFQNKSKFFRSKKLQLFASRQNLLTKSNIGQQPQYPSINTNQFLSSQQKLQQISKIGFPLIQDQIQQQIPTQIQSQIPTQIQSQIPTQIQSQIPTQIQQQIPTPISVPTDQKQQVEQPVQKINATLIEEPKIVPDFHQQQSEIGQPQELLKLQDQQFQQQFQQTQQFPIQNSFPRTIPNYRNNPNIQPMMNQNYNSQPQQQVHQQNQQNQFSPIQRQFNKNYKRVPCTKFHSPQGCMFGERCNFIHDYNYAGVPSPNMYKYVNQKQLKQMNFSDQFQDQPQQQEQQQQQQEQQNTNLQIQQPQQLQQSQQPQQQFPQQFNYQFKNNFQNQNLFRKPNFYNQNQNFQQQNNNFQSQPQNQMLSAPFNNNNIPFNQRFNNIPNYKNQYQNMNMQNLPNIQNPSFNEIGQNDNNNEHIQEE